MRKVNYADLPINRDEEPIRLFKSDFLEFFTHIHPAVVPVLWTPVVLYFLARAISDLGGSAGPWGILGGFATGVAAWTFSEYALHRFLFHYEPSHPALQRAWYLIHGVHHEQPQCRTRLVMPPILSVPLAFAFYGLFHLVVAVLLGLPLWVAPLFSGFIAGYIAYDMLHYSEHHLAMRWGILKYLKRYHLLHHFKTPDDRFGITSPLWDRVFGTLPRERAAGTAAGASSVDAGR